MSTWRCLTLAKARGMSLVFTVISRTSAVSRAEASVYVWQPDPKVGQAGEAQTVLLDSPRVTWPGNHDGVYPMPGEMPGDNRTHTTGTENHNPHIRPPVILLARDYGGSVSMLSTKALPSRAAPGIGPDIPATGG